MSQNRNTRYNPKGAFVLSTNPTPAAQSCYRRKRHRNTGNGNHGVTPRPKATARAKAPGEFIEEYLCPQVSTFQYPFAVRFTGTTWQFT